jgi:hypothetical protein
LNSNTVGGGASTLAEGLNPSAAGGATGGNGGGGPPPNPDPSSSTQSDNPTTKTGKVTIIIHQPGKP